ncbi:MAG: glycosyl transferase family 90 [Marinobacter sp.]
MRVGDNFSKNLNKLGYYSGNAMRALVPRAYWQRQCEDLMAKFATESPERKAAIEARVAYYNRLSAPFTLSSKAELAGDFTFAGKSTAYCFDFRNLIQCFPRHCMVDYQFGDITEIPGNPCFVKSRPVRHDISNAHSVLLKLNSVRHYRFVEDLIPFRQKTPKAVWRGKSNRQHRIDFATRFIDHPLCNIGCVLHKEAGAQPYHRDFMSIEEQLQYQFVVSVEGIDVATNLKWIMASNSLCLMRRPRFETWFMEGALVPGYHYVELADDHSDLPEKVRYYQEHPDEAEAIIANANHYVEKFFDPQMEQTIALLVIQKYLQLSGQKVGNSPDLRAKPSPARSDFQTAAVQSPRPR